MRKDSSTQMSETFPFFEREDLRPNSMMSHSSLGMCVCVCVVSLNPFAQEAIHLMDIW